MDKHITQALFVYEADASKLLEQCEANDVGCQVTGLPLEQFEQKPGDHVHPDSHVLVSASLDGIKRVLRLAMEHGFSVGVIPMPGQDQLRRYLALPKNSTEAIETALLADPQPIDIALCNGHIMLFRAVIGWMPMLDAPGDLSRLEIIKHLFSRWIRLRLYPYTITTANERKIETAAAGCMLVERHEGDMVSRLIGDELSVQDGKAGLLISSPYSMVEYLRFLYQIFSRLSKKTGLPDSVAYLQSRSFRIDSEKQQDVYIDGSAATQTPVEVTVLPGATRVNVGASLLQKGKQGDPEKETVRVDNLRNKTELTQSIARRVPFFSYATEERFRDLFVALQEDANIHTNYVVFILLSTGIASLGLFLDSAAIIIGAMILAPLMAPLVSLSMGLLRADEKLFWHSMEKLALGTVLALIVAATVSLIFPSDPLTSAMAARLNPSLPDLFVAILSGIAAAWARSMKEAAQNLAGVAIAVALVPPLAVAGIGLGRGDLWFFGQAFLLFLTNLIGIVLAASISFRVLGFSPAIHDKRRLGFILALLVLVAIPLGSSSLHIAQRWEAEQTLERQEFLINDKHVLITDVELQSRQGENALMINIEVQEPLAMPDLTALQEKIRGQLQGDFIIRLSVQYKL